MEHEQLLNAIRNGASPAWSRGSRTPRQVTRNLAKAFDAATPDATIGYPTPKSAQSTASTVPYKTPGAVSSTVLSPAKSPAPAVLPEVDTTHQHDEPVKVDGRTTKRPREEITASSTEKASKKDKPNKEDQ